MSRRGEGQQEDDAKWLALLLMRCMLQLVHEIRRRYGMPRLVEGPRDQ